MGGSILTGLGGELIWLTGIANLEDDVSGNGNDATITGNMVGASQSIEFPGTNDWLTLPQFWTAPTVGTVGFWFQSDAGTGEQRIVSLNDDDCWILIRINSGAANRITAGVRDTVLQQIIYSTTTTDLHFVVLTFTANDELELWVDGVSRGTTALGTTTEVSSAARRIGASRNGTFDYNGTLNDFRVFERKLDDAEIEYWWDGGQVALGSPYGFQSAWAHNATGIIQ